MTKCKNDNCKKRASYGIDKPMYCKLHAELGMVNVVSKTCQYPGCKKIPNYNFDGQKKGLFCASHKQQNMVNVKDKTCAHPECNKIPIYNIEGQKKGLYCVSHKQQNMVNVKNKTCQYPDCKKQPAYNIEGQKKALFCVEHKQQNMVDVKSKKCQHPGCKKIPNYNDCNAMGQKKALFCQSHKKEGMVNVVSKTCQHPGCKTRAIYNVEGQKKGLFCVEHKQQNMVNVVSKTCQYPGCKKQPVYNFEGQKKKIFCASHKQEGMINVKDKRCKSEWCDVQASNPKYEGYCLFCFMHIYPEKEICRNYKTKERTTVDYILSQFPNFTWITDKKIEGGCSRRRPDLYLDLGYQVVIVEVDENQHVDYDCSCENKRMMEISQDINHRPLVFIRFNPDEYSIFKTVETSTSKEIDYMSDDESVSVNLELDTSEEYELVKKITSCWSVNKQGVCCVSKRKEKEWNERLLSLKTQIEYWSHPENKSCKLIEVIELFYDQKI